MNDQWIERAQSSAGGWIYTPDSGGDEGSVTVTQVQALRACRMAGIVVDKKTIDRAVDYIKKCQNPDGGISYSLGSRVAAVGLVSAVGPYVDEPALLPYLRPEGRQLVELALPPAEGCVHDRRNRP